ncbi:hypothetical protein QBC38DRAFT_549564 [Podospora fimiseda]|uniref:Uncharacterized protein n=1 Tax=Podospora fimiseda TaxID=252190 RepID=A0AAN6YNI6_9PEZI|nr:hypothetical protein QBC38DRAFT_549564 [Podospora fimiseda]
MYLASILRFMHQLTTIPVPKVLKIDRKCENVLGRPYVVQKRASGIDLSRYGKNLQHGSLCLIAKELGAHIRTMLQMKSQRAGKVVYGGSDELLTEILKKRRASCMKNNKAGLGTFGSSPPKHHQHGWRFNEPAVTAIVDWDDALFVPAFAACSPPVFLWSQPQSTQAQKDEIKNIFDTAAGPLFKNQTAFPSCFK